MVQRQSESYPNTQASEGMEFRRRFAPSGLHRRVGIGVFDDGDKNTLILDRDGSLTGMKLVGPDRKPIGNVPRLAQQPAVQRLVELRRRMPFDRRQERSRGRPTSLISPSPMATLEFSSLFPQALQNEVKTKGLPLRADRGLLEDVARPVSRSGEFA